jgi:hypothetical protein
VSNSKKKCLAKPKRRTLAVPLREFLDVCVVPALVEKYFAEQKPNGGKK